jgi:hypothetical protein
METTSGKSIVFKCAYGHVPLTPWLSERALRYFTPQPWDTPRNYALEAEAQRFVRRMYRLIDIRRRQA